MKIEQAKQLTDQALDQLIQALEAGKSDPLKTYLATMSRFYKYSWGNLLLIAFQMPSATRVAGFHTWKSLPAYASYCTSIVGMRSSSGFCLGRRKVFPRL